MKRHFLTLVLLTLPCAADPSRAVRECAQCHPAQARPHPATSMAHAMELPRECAILRDHPLLTFEDAGYTYRIERRGDESIYTVTNGHDTMAVRLGWAFGLGRAGQTYVFEKDGKLFESRVSFYSELNGLDLTMGAANAKPANLLQAAGRVLEAEDARCFGCHSTGGVTGRKLTLDRLTPGVQCERCHGSAEDHLKGLKTGDSRLAQMKDLRTMSAEDTANFCGQCHRTWSDIASSGAMGVVNVRFQPYRLTTSKCYDSDDRRIRCTACHDPHREIDTVNANYDVKCQACHGGGKSTALRCKIAVRECASCHMPKLEMPGAHHKFTDHDIRIVRANAPYPN